MKTLLIHDADTSRRFEHFYLALTGGTGSGRTSLAFACAYGAVIVMAADSTPTTGRKYFFMICLQGRPLGQWPVSTSLIARTRLRTFPDGLHESCCELFLCDEAGHLQLMQRWRD
jgi:hypothetical protein